MILCNCCVLLASQLLQRTKRLAVCCAYVFELLLHATHPLTAMPPQYIHLRTHSLANFSSHANARAHTPIHTPIHAPTPTPLHIYIRIHMHMHVGR